MIQTIADGAGAALLPSSGSDEAAAFFQSLHVSHAATDLDRLLECVARDCGRVQITRDTHVCVLISKAELDSLESALEILSATEGAQAMHHHLNELAAASRTFATQAPVGT